jgi:hypothetical protein
MQFVSQKHDAVNLVLPKRVRGSDTNDAIVRVFQGGNLLWENGVKGAAFRNYRPGTSSIA